MQINEYKYLTHDELETESEIAFLNNDGNIEKYDSTVVRGMVLPTTELLNKSIMILLDIMKEQNIDIIQEVVDRLENDDNINDLIIHSMLADRVDYITSENKN